MNLSDFPQRSQEIVHRYILIIDLCTTVRLLQMAQTRMWIMALKLGLSELSRLSDGANNWNYIQIPAPKDVYYWRKEYF